MAFFEAIGKWLIRNWGAVKEVWDLNKRVKALELPEDGAPQQQLSTQFCPSCGSRMHVVKTEKYTYGPSNKVSDELQWSYFQCRQDCYYNKIPLKLRTRGVSAVP